MTLVSLLVDEYEIALEYYFGKLGFHLREDTPLSADKRWVVVSPTDESETGLLLARAATDTQRASIGNQAGGHVFLFLETDNFERDFDLYSSRGVSLVELPREEVYGKVGSNSNADATSLFSRRPNLLETHREPPTPSLQVRKEWAAFSTFQTGVPFADGIAGDDNNNPGAPDDGQSKAESRRATA